MPLERLEKRGMLQSKLSESTPERGGRHKRIYEITADGKAALQQIYKEQQTMWERHCYFIGQEILMSSKPPFFFYSAEDIEKTTSG